MIMSLVMIMSSLRYRFPLDNKNLMFMVMIMIMFMIVLSLVGTKPKAKEMCLAGGAFRSYLKITTVTLSLPHP